MVDNAFNERILEEHRSVLEGGVGYDSDLETLERVRRAFLAVPGTNFIATAMDACEHLLFGHRQNVDDMLRVMQTRLVPDDLPRLHRHAFKFFQLGSCDAIRDEFAIMSISHDEHLYSLQKNRVAKWIARRVVEHKMSEVHMVPKIRRILEEAGDSECLVIYFFVKKDWESALQHARLIENHKKRRRLVSICVSELVRCPPNKNKLFEWLAILAHENPDGSVRKIKKAVLKSVEYFGEDMIPFTEPGNTFTIREWVDSIIG